MTTNREAFEAWIKADSTLPTDRDEHSYLDMTTALMWHAWQASRQRALDDAALLCDVTPPYPFRPSLEAAHAVRALKRQIDPASLEALRDKLRTDPAFALETLQAAGIATADGKLSERFGGPSRSQRMREAGFTPRPRLPSDE